MPKAKAEVLKALEIDDSVAEAHTALGFIEHWYEWDWPAADKEFRRAIELDPAGVSVHRSYSQFLTNMGRVDEAIVQAKRAVEIDPLSVLTNRVLANAFYHARQYDEAVGQCHKTIEFEPNYFSTYWSLGLAHMAQGNHREGLGALERGRSLGQGDPISEAVLGWGYGVAGRAEEARAILATLERRRTEAYLSAAVLAWIHFGLGEKDSGFELLEKAYEERDPLLALVYVTPAYDPVRSDSRFRDLVERMRFSDPILA